jgi:hypothetical protein
MPTASRQVMQIDSNDPSGPFTCLNWDSVAHIAFHLATNAAGRSIPFAAFAKGWESYKPTV